MSATSNAESENLSQANFVETPYQDQSWEVVGEVNPNQDFMPMEIGVVPREDILADPMFANYGGTSPDSGDKRWHLPENLAWVDPAQEVKDQAEEASKIKLSEAELEQIKTEAFAQGREAAMADAVLQNNERLATFEQRFSELFTDMHRQINEQMAETQHQAVQLTLEISRRIVGHAVEINPEYIVSVISDALAQAGGAAIRKIRISPQDMEFIEIVGVAKQIKDFDETWKFEADDTVRSGCIVETSAGEIDFQLDAAWERIKDNVIKVLK